MAGNHRRYGHLHLAIQDVEVSAADAARVHLYQHLTWARRRVWQVGRSKGPAGRIEDHRPHRPHHRAMARSDAVPSARSG
jgi:hypothetical protein